MIVMVSNQTGIEVGLMAARYPGCIGHMYSPGGERGPWRELPYALDNDAWPAHKNKRPRDEAGHRRLLAWSLIVMYYFLDLPLPEVAVTLQIPLGTVKSRLYRGLREMRAVLDADARPGSEIHEGHPA